MDRDPFDFDAEPARPPSDDVERPEGGEDDPALMGPVLEALKTVRDPEIPMDLVELGLIYELIVKKGGIVYVEMTLTTPACPVAASMPGEVETAIRIRPRRRRRARQARLVTPLGTRPDERRSPARTRDAVISRRTACRRSGTEWVIEKEAEHFSRRIRSLRIGVGTGGTAARPGMTGAVNDPLLENGVAARIAVDGAGVGATAGDPAVLDRYSCIGGQRFLQLGNDLVAVAGVHCRVLVTVEHNRRYDPRISRSAGQIAA